MLLTAEKVGIGPKMAKIQYGVKPDIFRHSNCSDDHHLQQKSWRDVTIHVDIQEHVMYFTIIDTRIIETVAHA